MHKALRRALMSLAAVPAATVTTALLAIPASATTHGPNMYSPVEAGYTATGTNFRYGRDDFTLPDPTAFAPYIKRVEFVSELWSSTRLTVLGVYASTSSTTYHAEAVVYNTQTRKRICATWSTTRPCPNTPSAWNTDTFPAGHALELTNLFARSTGTVHFTLTDKTASSTLSYAWTKAGTAYMTQVRLGAEFGCSPWTACGGGTNPYYKHPASPVTVVNMSDCVIETSTGHLSGFYGPFTWHKLKMTLNGVKSPVDEATIDNLGTGTSYSGGQFHVLLK